MGKKRQVNVRKCFRVPELLDPCFNLLSNDTVIIFPPQVIIDGAAVFFSDKEARRKQLFTMMSGVNSKVGLDSLNH